MTDDLKFLELRRGSVSQRPNELRDCYDIDRTRILHSAAFRRLQSKTQVIGIGEGDFYRTRLTHSMEVANLGRGIVQTLHSRHPGESDLFPTPNLIESICFSHDFGHPPFGHNGEVALNALMQDAGGFEGNGQTLRILSRLESKTSDHGLNLTRRTLLGVLKYPCKYSSVARQTEALPNHLRAENIAPKLCKPPKCYLDSETDVVQWILQPFSETDRALFQSQNAPTADAHGKSLHKSLDCSIMELADDISYSVHDLEDGIALGLIRKEHLVELSNVFNTSWGKEWELDQLVEKLYDEKQSKGIDRKWAIGALVHALIGSINLVENSSFSHRILKFNAKLENEAKQVVELIKGVALKHVIGLQTVQTLEFRGRHLVLEIFKALNSDPEKLMPEYFVDIYKGAAQHSKRRVVCDYVAGMTDNYATKMYERLFVPRLGTVFEKL